MRITAFVIACPAEDLFPGCLLLTASRRIRRAGSLVVINDPELVLNAALEGIGIAYLYEEYVAPMIADGRLVSLLDKSVLPVTEGFFLFYPSRRQNSAALRALLQAARAGA